MDRQKAVTWYWAAGLAVVIALVLGVRSVVTESSTNLEPPDPPPGMARATFAGGCFWCTEAILTRLKGVNRVVPGYTGGQVKGPSYKQVCTGKTGHAEAVQVTYDPKEVTYEQLLEVFWKTHDPTTPNRQGNDHGPQYRSAIFYHSDEQRRLAEQYKQKLDAARVWPNPVVTEIQPFTEFWRAEDDHLDYYARNPNQGYCAYIIGPKLEKLKKVFHDKLKPGAAQ